MTLSGMAKEYQGDYDGKYTLQPGNINGYMYWQQDLGLKSRFLCKDSKSIWYDSKFGGWNIGPTKNCGSTRCSQTISSAKICPHNVNGIWSVYDFHKWIIPKENIVKILKIE